MNKPVKIIVHHTGGTDLNPLADTSHHTAKMIKKWHLAKGWDDIGYNWVIERDGNVVKGRDESKSGAHTVGHNSNSIGICLSGNFDATLPTKAQEASLKKLLVEVMQRYNIKSDAIYPHRRFAKKTCFGNKLSDDWARLLVEQFDLSNVPTEYLTAELKRRGV